MQFIDIGVNLTNKAFAKDRDEVIQQAIAESVVQQIITGTDFESNQQALHLSQHFADILYCTAGCHPHHAKEWNQDLAQQIYTLAADPQVVAIGECGLDFHRNFSPVEQQEQAFAAQLQIAAELQMPVFMHERDANDRFISILKQYRNKIPKAVLHCFTGSKEDLLACLNLDLYIGITGWICDERRGQHLLDLIPLIPEDRLMIETDAPYLLPRTLTNQPKNKRNEPKFLPHIANFIAQALNKPLDLLAQQVFNNTKTFFNLD